MRAHITSQQRTVFCVKDFIRQTANRTMSPDDALLCWLYAIGKLSHEDAIMDNIAVQFAGPYEKPNVCLGAEGLLILYHFMGEELRLVNDLYKTEVQDILTEIIAGQNCDQHICMHDDGEIQELLAERGAETWTMPPRESKFFFVPTVQNESGEEEPFDAVLKRHVQTEAELRERLQTLEAKNAEMASELQSHSEHMRELKQLRASKDRKRTRGSGFCVQELCTELELDVPEAHMGTLCRKVINTFKSDHPGRHTFSKHKRVHFYPEDRALVADLLNEEHLNLQLWLLDNEAPEMSRVISQV